MKKYLALAAAVLLSLQLAVPAFADAASPLDPQQILSGGSDGVLLGLVIAAALVIAAVIGILILRKKKKQRRQAQAGAEKTNEEEPK